MQYLIFLTHEEKSELDRLVKISKTSTLDILSSSLRDEGDQFWGEVDYWKLFHVILEIEKHGSFLGKRLTDLGELQDPTFKNQLRQRKQELFRLQ